MAAPLVGFQIAQILEDAAADFAEFDIPSPGAQNAKGGDSGVCELGDVKINEFMANPSGSDSGAEWVELYNPGTVDLDLTGWFWNTETTAFLPLETFPMV